MVTEREEEFMQKNGVKENEKISEEEIKEEKIKEIATEERKEVEEKEGKQNLQKNDEKECSSDCDESFEGDDVEQYDKGAEEEDEDEEFLKKLKNKNKQNNNKSNCSDDSDDEKVGPMRSSIKKYGDLSYYYAHSKTLDNKNGEVKLANGGSPIPVEKTEKQNDEKQKNENTYKVLHRFSWCDNEHNVKLYLLPDMIPNDCENLSNENVQIDMQNKSINIIFYGTSHKYMLRVPELYEEILPEKSTYNILHNKVTFSLKKKVPDCTWFNFSRKD